MMNKILIILFIALGLGNDCFAKPITLQPDIVSDEWGEIILEFNGIEKKFRDVVILPSQEPVKWHWKWQKDGKNRSVGMSHVPGIRIVDVEHYILSQLEEQPDVIILSKGRGHGGQRNNPGPGILQIEPGVKEYLQEKGIEVYILKTAEAIEKYQQLRLEGSKRIAAMIHTTC